MQMRQDEALVTIAVFDTTFDASLARGALEAIGIRALVPEETLVGSRSGITLRSRLQVFESDRDRALVELRRMQMRVVTQSTDSD
jgi:hypothetical protein